MNKLNEIPGKSPFKVPDNYFEEVNRKIISAATGIDREVTKISFYQRYRTNLLIAASIAAFILIAFTGVTLLSHTGKSTQVSEILKGVSPDTYLNDIDLSSLESETALLPSSAGPDVSKKDIIEYLLQENIELSDIYEQL
jgi:hypothetical protein